MNFKQVAIEELLKNAKILAQEDDQVKLLSAIRFLYSKSHEWRAVLDFRKVSFKGAFTGPWKSLMRDFHNSMQLGFDISAAMRKAFDQGFVIGGENFIERTVLSISRSSSVSSFKELKVAVEKYDASYRDAFSEANGILAIFGAKRIYNSESLHSIKADENTSLSNEDWTDNMERAFSQLQKYVDAVEDVKDRLLKQLELYESDGWMLVPVDI